MDYGLEDRTVVITGAGSGNGRAVATAFADARAHVCVTDRDADAARAVAAELGARGQSAEDYELDVTNHGQIECALDAITTSCGTIDVLVKNAGIGARVPATELAPELGQHTEPVLLDLGYSWDDITRLKDRGAII